MAILEMKKIALFAHQDNKSALLKSIQELGAIEVTHTQFEGAAAGVSSEKYAHVDSMLADVRTALETIRRFDDEKSSFFNPKPGITIKQLSGLSSRLDEAQQIADKIKQYNADFAALKMRQQRILNQISQLEPFGCFDIPLETLGESAYTTSFLGTIPFENEQNLNQICEEFDTAYMEYTKTDGNLFAVYIIAHNDISELLRAQLKSFGFTDAPSKDYFGTTKNIIADYKKEHDKISNKMAGMQKEAKEFTQHKSLLCLVEDYLLTEQARERCVERLAETGAAFALEGWVISNDCDKIEQSLKKSAPEAYINFRNPYEDEIPPTAISNPPAVTPFEAVTDMYSIPSSRGFDPNLIMSIFYFIIFGMMMADVVYGIVLTVGAYLMLKIKKPTGMFRKITTVIMICGISGSLWGVFFGTVLSIEGIPYVLNPIQDAQGAMLTLIVCLGVGVIHIFTGLFIAMYMDIRRGRILDAVFDRFSWFLLISGCIMLILGGVIGTIGSYLTIAGAAILLFTQGRHKKGIIKKITGGLASLYGVTSYIGDILSYSRIFGMGLATTVIAMVFNTIGGLLMGNFIGYIMGIIILTFGHVFNIAINTLGAFVHTARLQYIEFFNKFYEGDGHAFMPLAFRTRHHKISN